METNMQLGSTEKKKQSERTMVVKVISSWVDNMLIQWGLEIA